MSDKIQYPFTPKSTASLVPGQFWGIPLKNGTFACGRVLSFSIDERGRRHTWYFLAGLIDWSGVVPPTAESIAGKKVIAFGSAHMDAILDHGRKILGYRSLDADSAQPDLLIVGEELCLGLEYVREATNKDRLSYPACPDWSQHGILEEAEKLFGHATNKGTETVSKQWQQLSKKRESKFKLPVLGPGADEKAIRILLDIYGPKPGVTPTQAEVDYARAAGSIVEPAPLSHDQIINRIIAARSKISPVEAARDFVASLSIRRVESRAALGSLAVFRLMRPHSCDPLDEDPDVPTGKWCLTCGENNTREPRDLTEPSVG